MTSTYAIDRNSQTFKNCNMVSSAIHKQDEKAFIINKAVLDFGYFKTGKLKTGNPLLLTRSVTFRYFLAMILTVHSQSRFCSSSNFRLSFSSSKSTTYN